MSRMSSIRNEDEVVQIEMANLTGDLNEYDRSIPESTRHKNYVILTQAKTFRWGTMQSNLLKLPDRNLWQAFILVLCIVNFIICTSRLLFAPTSPMSINVLVIYFFIDMLYLMDVTLRILHKYWKRLQEQVTPVRTPLWFIVVDMITLLIHPFSYGFLTVNITRHIRLVTILRLHRLRLIVDTQANVQMNRWIWLAVSFIIFNIIIIHSCVCIWQAFKCYQEPCSSEVSGIQYFILATYYTIQQLGGIGLGEGASIKYIESMEYLAVMLIGYFLTTILYIVLFSIAFANKRLVRFKFYTKLAGVASFYKYTEITSDLKEQLKLYSTVLWEKKSGLSDAPYFYQLPSCLQMSLTYDINCSHLRRSLLFAELPEPIMRRLSLIMKHEFMIPGQVIYHQNVVKHGMISIANGIVEVLADEDGQSPIVSFKSGTILGEVSLFLSIPSKATVKAATYTELQVLRRTDFIALMLHFPDAMRQLRDRLSMRLDMARANKAASQGTEEIIFNLLVPRSHAFRPIEYLKRYLTGKSIDESKFITDYMPLYKLAENVTMIEQPPICLNYKLPWILEPESSFIRVWEILIVVSILIICLPLPYYAVFLTSEIPVMLRSLSTITNIMYLVNIYVQLSTAVVLKDRTLRNFPQIVRYQMRSLGIYLDVLSILPLDEFKYIFNTERTAKNFYAFQLLILLRMWRFFAFINKKETKAKHHIIPMKIFKWLVYLTLLMYYSGILLYIIACPFHECIEDSWYVTNMKKAVAEQQMYPSYKHKLVMSMYFASTTVMLTGFGDIVPNRLSEKMVLVLYMLIGIFFTGFCTLDFISVFLVNEEHRHNYRKNMLIIKHFLDIRKVPDPLIKRVQNYMMLQWEFDNGIGQYTLVHDTPYYLKKAIQVCLLQDTISSIPLFRNVEIDFLMMIVRGAKLRLLPPDEVICYSGDETRDVIIIHRGECISMVGGKKRRLGPGSGIGALEMLCGVPKQWTVKTITHCFIVTISFSEFARSIRMFPLHKDEIDKVLNEGNIVQNIITKNRARKSISIASLESRSRTHFIKFFGASFFNTYAACKRSGGVDPYWQPFAKMGKLCIIGFFLLPICVRPNGPFLKVWNILRCILIIVMTMTLPLIVAIPPYMSNLDSILTASYIVGVVDVYINLHVGYYGAKGQLITHPRWTSSNYFKKSFIIDIMSLVPLKLIVLWAVRDHDEGHDPMTHVITPHTRHCVWHVNLLFQLHRVFGGLNYLEADIRNQARMYSFMKIFPILFLTLNMCTCMLFAKICTYKFYLEPNNDLKDSLIVYHFENRTTTFGYLICNEQDSLQIDKYNHIKNPLSVYIVLFYWVTSCLTQSGPGDITARSAMGMLYAITLSLGLIIFSCLYGYWTSLTCRHINVDATYEDHYKHLLRFLSKENLEPNLYSKVKRYYEYVWQRSGGVDPQTYLGRINTALAEDVMLGLYERALREVPLFSKVEQSFVRVVATHLAPLYYLKNDCILRTRYIQYKIFIILRGSIEIKDKDDKVLASMGIGGLFGNIRSGTPSLSTVTVVATGNLDVLVLNSNEFYSILTEYPRVAKYMSNLLKSVTHYIMPVTILDETEEIKLLEELNMAAVSITSDEDIKYPSSAWNFLIPCRWFQFALRPDHKLFITVRFLVMICTFYHILATSYFFVSHHMPRYFTITLVISEFIYWIRLFLKFHEAYLNVYGMYVTKFPLILEHYFKNKWNVLRDVVPNIPFFTLGKFFPDESRQIAYTFLLLYHWLRIIYILEFFRRVEIPLLSNRKTFRIMKILMVHTFILHTSSCIWLSTACRFGTCYKHSWLYVYDPKMLDGAMFYNYATSAYYVITLLTSTGTGDIIPGTTTEVGISIILMIVGKCLTAFIIGDIISMIYLSRSDLMSYEYKIKELATYLKNQNLSEMQLQNIWKYAHVLWTEETGNQMPVFFENAPRIFICDIMYDLYGYHVKSSILFEDLEDALIRQICAKLKRVIFTAGNYIVQQGDADGCMYWVHKGTVSILTVHSNLTETVHDVLKAPSMFGHVTGLKYGMGHRFSFRAETTTYMLIMVIKDWEEIFRMFPEEREKIYERLTNLHSIL